MTVAELITRLQTAPQDATVVIMASYAICHNDDGTMELDAIETYDPIVNQDYIAGNSPKSTVVLEAGKNGSPITLLYDFE